MSLFKVGVWYKNPDPTIWSNFEVLAFKPLEDRYEGFLLGRKRRFRADVIEIWESHNWVDSLEKMTSKINFMLEIASYYSSRYDKCVEVTDPEEIKMFDDKLMGLLAEEAKKKREMEEYSQTKKKELYEALAKKGG